MFREEIVQVKKTLIQLFCVILFNKYNICFFVLAVSSFSSLSYINENKNPPHYWSLYSGFYAVTCLYEP